MSKSAPRLGRGLSAIVGSHPAPAPAAPPPAASAEPTGAPRELPIDHISPNPRQPRVHFGESALQELAESIRVHGIVQPVVVRPVAGDRYELIAGERRFRAAHIAGLKTIPAVIRPCSDTEALELALVENLQREDLNPLERARAYRTYLDEIGTSIEELAGRLGESRGNVSNYLRLMNLSTDIQAMITTGELAMGQARAVAGITDPKRQLAVALMAVRRNLSVRQVEELAKEPPASRERPPANDGTARHLAEVEGQFTRSLGLTVKLFPGRRKNSGRIVIRYNSLEEFDRVSERLGGGSTSE